MSDDVLYAQAVLGKDAEQFLASDLGRTMVGIAEQEARAAILKLKEVSAWRFWRIVELQNEIKRAESFEGWLKELYMRGEQALQTLEMQDE